MSVLRSRFVRDDLRAAVAPWAVARVLVVGALLLSRHLYDEVGRDPRPVQLGQGLFAWDAAFYREIAEHGYAALPNSALRFFPLVPLMARGLGTVLLGHDALALLRRARPAQPDPGLRAVVEELFERWERTGLPGQRTT